MKCLFALAGLVVLASSATLTPFPNACSFTCDSASNFQCAFSNGTNIPIGATFKVQNGQNLTCASGGSGQTYVFQICSNQTPIDQVCFNSATVNPNSFTTPAALLAWAFATNTPISIPAGVCNTACLQSQLINCLPAATGVGYSCSQCFTNTGCTASREDDESALVEVRATRANTAQVYVICSAAATLSQQNACFQSAVCAGLILPNVRGVLCYYLNNGVYAGVTCPSCSQSKKGLLGLLGLLGLIPLLLCISLLCLLLLCCIRRKKTAAAVPFATFDPGLPPVAATYPPLAPTCPVVY